MGVGARKPSFIHGKHALMKMIVSKRAAKVNQRRKEENERKKQLLQKYIQSD